MVLTSNSSIQQKSKLNVIVPRNERVRVQRLSCCGPAKIYRHREKLLINYTSFLYSDYLILGSIVSSAFSKPIVPEVSNAAKVSCKRYLQNRPDRSKGNIPLLF